MFPAIFDKPEGMRFIEQEEGEYIELLLRQHGITNLPWIFWSIIGLIIPFVLPAIIRFSNLGVLISIPVDIITSLLVLWYLLITAYIIESFLFWYFNIYIVTNKHLIDVNFFSLLSRDITEVRLDDVQSARSKVRGIIGSLFYFGDVIIETAAKGQQVEFLSIPKPDFVADRISDLQGQAEGGNDAP